MPPAKKDPPTPAAIAQAQQDAASDGIDYYELPKALVQRIAKSSIPEGAKLQKDTVTALQKGSTVFINYLAAFAHDVAIGRDHKSVAAADVLKALEIIDFADIALPLQHELQIFRENAKNSKKSSGSANKSGRSAGTGDSASARSKSANLAPKSKGKERASDSGHGPSPLSTSVSAADVAVASGTYDEKDEGDESAEEDGGDAVDEDEDELADDVDVDEDVGDEGDEVEEIVDQMAVDEAEVRQDTKEVDLGVVNGVE